MCGDGKEAWKRTGVQIGSGSRYGPLGAVGLMVHGKFMAETVLRACYANEFDYVFRIRICGA